MKKTAFILSSLISISPIVSAQSLALEYEKALAYLNTKGEVYFTFAIQSRQEIAALTKFLSIDDVNNLNVMAYANKKQFDIFIPYNYTYTVLPHPGDSHPNLKMYTPDTKAAFDFTLYPTYDAYLGMAAILKSHI